MFLRPSSRPAVRLRVWLAAAGAALLVALGPAHAAVVQPPKVAAFWQRLAVCETGGRWDWGRFASSPRRRSLEGTRFEGGLGFAASTWREWAKAVRVVHRYPHAWMAPPHVQVEVAAYGLRHGGYWGCLHRD
jgi:hypothetical protein